jgi:hypothetical protein
MVDISIRDDRVARLKGNTEGSMGGEGSVGKYETDRSMRLLSLVLL